MPNPVVTLAPPSLPPPACNLARAAPKTETPRSDSAVGFMKRRTLKRLRPSANPGPHHHVYVVLLNPAVGRLRKVRAENPDRDPAKTCLYVGMTGLTPEERFANHKAGIKDAWVVHRYGLRLLPELYSHLNPMPFDAAVQMEKDLAEDLRKAGHTVTGGH
jgi:hypothetical protein